MIIDRLLTPFTNALDRQWKAEDDYDAWFKYGRGVYDSQKGIDTKYQQQLNEQQNALAMQLWDHQQSNAHQLEVQDLKAAGINKYAQYLSSQNNPVELMTQQEPSTAQQVNQPFVKVLERLLKKVEKLENKVK